MLRICSSQYLYYEGKYIENTLKFFQYPSMKMNAQISKTKKKQNITQNNSITNTIKENLSKVNIKFVTAQSKVITTFNLKQELQNRLQKYHPKVHRGNIQEYK